MTDQDTAPVDGVEQATAGQVATEVAPVAQDEAGQVNPTGASSGGAGTAGSTPPPVPVASDDPTRWGRVDEAGKVYVKVPEDPSGAGEREVGSWQAGEPAEGLAHFARRFDDMRTEVELLEARLKSGAGDPKQALTSAKHVRDGLADAAVVGDLVALRARVDFVIASAGVAVDKAKVARDAARAESAQRKQTLVEEAETLANESTQWKSAGDRLRAILDEWKTIRGVDRKTDEQLWRRFSKARDAFNRRRGAHFADLDRQRSTAKTRKQELVDEAERLAGSDDWGVTAGRYKDLMIEWKAAGRAPKESDDALWQAFRAAQDKFFARRSAAFDERDAEFGTNAKLKEELLAEAEAIDPANGLEAARNALYKLQERWDQVGKVPRERVRELEGRLRTIEERVRGAVDAQGAAPTRRPRPGWRSSVSASASSRPRPRRPGRPATSAAPSRPRPRPPSGASGSPPPSRP
ncbi:ATPase [Kutzneria sp. 744]|nr:ATPase [Kutzneria sp. 744]